MRLNTAKRKFATPNCKIIIDKPKTGSRLPWPWECSVIKSTIIMKRSQWHARLAKPTRHIDSKHQLSNGDVQRRDVERRSPDTASAEYGDPKPRCAVRRVPEGSERWILWRRQATLGPQHRLSRTGRLVTRGENVGCYICSHIAEGKVVCTTAILKHLTGLDKKPGTKLYKNLY